MYSKCDSLLQIIGDIRHFISIELEILNEFDGDLEKPTDFPRLNYLSHYHCHPAQGRPHAHMLREGVTLPEYKQFRLFYLWLLFVLSSALLQ